MNTATIGKTSRLQHGAALFRMFVSTTVLGGVGAVLVGWLVALIGDALK